MFNGNVNYLIGTFPAWFGAPLETLSEYVSRVMRQKGLSAREVERRSARAITDAYVMQIVKGSTTNLSISKAQALATGLGADEDELFRVARGIPPKRKSATLQEPWSAAALVKAIDRIAGSPEISRAVQLLLALTPQKLRLLLKILEREAR
jgi:transcriptional regulator with XRE-family HTH domain